VKEKIVEPSVYSVLRDELINYQLSNITQLPAFASLTALVKLHFFLKLT
jgi:hypothetical protein